VFEASETPTTTFVCDIGPSSPGLLIRIVTTRFVGSCCTADEAAAAVWSVAALCSGPTASGTGISPSAPGVGLLPRAPGAAAAMYTHAKRTATSNARGPGRSRLGSLDV
jgi:hypothetical protein